MDNLDHYSNRKKTGQMPPIFRTVWQLTSRTVGDLIEPIFVKQMIWVAAFGGFMVATLYWNIKFLETHYPNPVRPDDLLLDIIPEMKLFIPIGEGLAIIGIIVMTYILWEGHFRQAPKLLFVLFFMFLLRGFTLPLTPLAQIQPPAENYAEQHIIAQIFYQGMFFSGHTATAFTLAFFAQEHRLRPLLFALASMQAFSLVASHSHYSIDIVGGFFVAFFVTHFDFMRLVPRRLHSVKWMPWYTATRDKRTPATAPALPSPGIQEPEPAGQP
jgi:membrane-associated phospholipid phosphatase